MVEPPDGSLLPTDKSLLPTDKSLLPTDKLLLPTDESLLPTDKSLLPTDEPLLPTDESLLPTDEPLLPTDRPLLPTDESLHSIRELDNHSDFISAHWANSSDGKTPTGIFALKAADKRALRERENEVAARDFMLSVNCVDQISDRYSEEKTIKIDTAALPPIGLLYHQ